jgi:Gpi18-like mannosyltransferase
VIGVATPLCSYTSLLLASFLLSNLCFLGNVMLLHSLTLRVLRSSRLAYLSAVCFLLSPASIFHLAHYSEASFMLLSLAAMLLREQGRSWASALLFACATLVRANGWIFAGFFCFDALQTTLHARGSRSVARCATIAGAWLKASVLAVIVGQSAWTLASRCASALVRFVVISSSSLAPFSLHLHLL